MPDHARDYARGDRVRLPGGPVMVVEDVYSAAFAYRYRCVWKGRDGRRHHDLFRAEQLEPAPPDQDGGLVAG